MQYVFRAQPESHRLAEWDVYRGIIDQYVIVPGRVVGIDAEQVVFAN